MARQFSYSESDIDLPRLARSIPLIDEPHLIIRHAFEPPQIKSSSPLNWALRFLVHLILIGMFETIFFWQYVGPSENTALSGLVHQYLASTVTACAALSPSERSQVATTLRLVLNQTAMDIAGDLATTDRQSYNNGLLLKSWLYVVGLCIATLLIGGVGHLRYTIPVKDIILENVALVVLLGAYEAMFFNTVVFQYRTLSMPELDQMVVDDVFAAC